MSDSSRYEVQLKTRGSWAKDSFHPGKVAAMVVAQKLIKAAKCDGVRICGLVPVKPADASVGTRELARGAYLFRQGAAGDEAYVIESGHMEVLLGERGSERIFGVLDRADMVGEIALIDDQPRMALARAKTAAVLTVVPKSTFRARIDRIADIDPFISLPPCNLRRTSSVLRGANTAQLTRLAYRSDRIDTSRAAVTVASWRSSVRMSRSIAKE
ncbi:MAG: cyclic nucleotide-binding domain-containing protein [Alphaproteobacteria bacterium]|nr:cyclic nucleotide-binding domain-containing protein [Alphaproteobacteria bacterium]